MGIEPTRALLRNLENTRFRVTPALKCDGRVNCRGIWGHVGIHKAVYAAHVLGRSAGRPPNDGNGSWRLYRR
jgi:hypothetical protein